MALGYEGLVLFDCEADKTGGTPVLVNSFDAPWTQSVLESGSVFGGRISALSNDARYLIGQPHTYDYPDYMINMDGEVSPTLITSLVDWIALTRNQSKNIYAVHSDAQSVFLKECFWQAIDLNTQQGSEVVFSISATALEREETVGNTYPENRTGVITTGVGNFNQSFIASTALNHEVNKDPIPFWNTSVQSSTILDSKAEVLSWRMSFGQDVEKVFGCGAAANPRAPDIVGIGPMRITGELELYVTTDSYALTDILYDNTLIFNIGGTSVTLTQVEMQEEGTPLGDAGDMQRMNYTFNAFGMSL